jgi:arylsulfatase A-like enzyme
MFSADWSDAANTHGVRGSVASGGTAGHGSASPWDVHNTLIAAGPDLKQGATIDVPSGNVDFAPTFLQMLGIPIPPSMQGRPLDEALKSSSSTVTTRTIEHTAATADGRYWTTATFSTVETGGKTYRYFDKATTARK